MWVPDMSDIDATTRCPHGHEVPRGPSTCSICGAEMEVPDAKPATELDGTARGGPSTVAWAALGLLAMGALAIPFLQDDVVIADDFSQPAALRSWPNDPDGGSMGYEDGSYHMIVPSDEDLPWAYRELPSAMDAVQVEVDVEATSGRPAVAVLCIYRVGEVEDPAGTTSVEDRGSYTFFYDPAEGGSYAIFGFAERRPLAEGTLSPGGAGRLSVTCSTSNAGGGTALSMWLGDGKPIQVTDPDGSEAFRGIALGAFSMTGGDAVTFDNLRVTLPDSMEDE